MSLDYKSDVRFQAAMQKILATANLQHGADVSAHEAEKVLVGKLIDLRTDFVIAVWVQSEKCKALYRQTQRSLRSEVENRHTPIVHSEEEKGTFGKFVLLRNTKAAQEFLTQNQYFFMRIDRQIYADMKDAVNARVADELRTLS